MDKEDFILQAIWAVWCGYTNSARPNLQLYAETETSALAGGDVHDRRSKHDYYTARNWKLYAKRKDLVLSVRHKLKL